MLNKNQEKVLKIIGLYPHLTQNKIAEKIGLNRNSVASIIRSLTQEKRINKRAYELNEVVDYVCIGQLLLEEQIDSAYSPSGQRYQEDSSSPLQFSGTSFLTGKNLAQLLQKTSFISQLESPDNLLALDYQWDFQLPASFLKQLLQFKRLILDGEVIHPIKTHALLPSNWLQNAYYLLHHCHSLIVDTSLNRVDFHSLMDWCAQWKKPFWLVKDYYLDREIPKLCPALEGGLVIDLAASERYFQQDLSFHQALDKWQDHGYDEILLYHHSELFYCQVRTQEIHHTILDRDLSATSSFSSGILAAILAAFLYGQQAYYSIHESLELALTNAYEQMNSQRANWPALNPTNLEKSQQDLQLKGRFTYRRLDLDGEDLP